MSKQIHTTFRSAEDARVAQHVLHEQGFERIRIEQNELIMETVDENWIAAFEIVNSLGGDVEQTIAEIYGLEDEQSKGEQIQDPPIPEQQMEPNLVDPRAYLDANLGYGDYELIEPYILHRYQKLDDEADPTEQP
ncbi:hypothetical protein BEP19_01400 [Ammoniphilus oxalaticus]|uniref:Uncharacterized protein n=1 Tax=Ammoniphilus oxalaticus TaxID=66863 RepID=A0A419SMW3_9BACL|nr:hypothetical protein [Ammoniphilus oxalaticus]RKD25627.1 hypothetical protein BEP19_01400 [Ammoniphilus oxalaticus]